MLTKHKYEDVVIDIDKDDSSIFKCCNQEEPEDPKCVDCCYDSWKSELKKVTKSYAEKQEEALYLTKKLGFITDRRNKFKTWLDELNKAEDLARKICSQLEVIASQSDKIWYNACRAVQAIEILYCMLRDFYSQTDYLKTRYEVLQKCIDNNTNPVLVKDQGILKCLKEYYEKLVVVIKTRDEIIKAILEAIRLSNLIRNHINTTTCEVKKCPPDNSSQNPPSYNPCDPKNKPCDCDDKSKKFYGFKTVICEWYCAFGCDDDCKPGEDPCGSSSDPCLESATPQNQVNQSNTQTQTQTQTGPCKEYKCEIEPMFEFPICKNDYKCYTKKRYESDEACVRQLESDLKDVNKQKESLFACKQSLNKAIDEVNPQTRCK